MSGYLYDIINAEGEPILRVTSPWKLSNDDLSVIRKEKGCTIVEVMQARPNADEVGISTCDDDEYFKLCVPLDWEKNIKHV